MEIIGDFPDMPRIATLTGAAAPKIENGWRASMSIVQVVETSYSTPYGLGGPRHVDIGSIYTALIHDTLYSDKHL